MIDVEAAVRRALADRYDLERELGGGGMSRVFVVRERRLGRREVLKLLPPEQAGAVSYARFQREIALAARLQHPHIVPLLGTGEIDGMPYFTMPFVDGESVRARLARTGEFALPEAVRVLREVASALEHAHAHGIVHRDIKPDNILLTQGIAMVADFGVAKALLEASTVGGGTLTTAGIAVGTPAYMSPEQATADPAVDHRSDLYSLGVVAYELLCGQPPFTARTTQALVAAHVVEAPVALRVRRPSVPAALASLVMGCLEKRAADRPQSAAEIVRALDVLGAAEPVTSAPAPGTPAAVNPAAAGQTTAKATARAGGSRRLGAWLGLAGMAAVAVITVWVTRNGEGGTAPMPSTRLLIAPFENLTGDDRFANLGRLASSQLTSIVAGVDESAVVPVAAVVEALGGSSVPEGAAMRRVAAAARAGLLMTGSVLRRGDSVLVQGVVTDVASGESVATLEPVGGPSADPLVAIEALGDRLLSTLRARQELTDLPRGVRPPTFAALQHFIEGYDKFAYRSDPRGAREDFVRAVAEDSLYVQAYVLILRLDINRGDWASADSIRRLIARIPGRRTNAERWHIAHLSAVLDGRRQEQLRSASELAALDSSAVSLGLVSTAANGLLQPRLSLRAGAAREPLLNPRALGAIRTWAREKAEAVHQLGEHELELQHWIDVQERLESPITALGGRLRAYAGLGRPTAALALMDTLERLSARDATTLLIEGAMEFRAHGDTATALLLVDRVPAARAAARAAGPEAGSGPQRIGYPEVLVPLLTGQHDSAAVLLTRWTGDTTRVLYAGLRGVIEARRGNAVEARRIAEALAARSEPWLFGEHTYWSGVILATLGEPERAMERLRQSHAQGQVLSRWHAAWELEPLRGYAPFRAFITPRG